MRKSTDEESGAVYELVRKTREEVSELIACGKKVHAILDFDGVLADTRSDDVFALSGHDLKTYFAHEERLLFQSPGPGPWLLPFVHQAPTGTHFPKENFSYDIVTARSSTLALRIHLFCMEWRLNPRWMLFVGHQPKKESYRIILQSLKNDPDYHIFCIDDNAAHIDRFVEMSAEENMQERTRGIVSSIIRTYDKTELKEYLQRVMGTRGKPIRVRDPSDDMRGFLVLPEGVTQFREQMESLLDELASESHAAELRAAFVKVHGEVGRGTFKTEKELEQAMREFILGITCP